MGIASGTVADDTAFCEGTVAMLGGHLYAVEFPRDKFARIDVPLHRMSCAGLEELSEDLRQRVDRGEFRIYVKNPRASHRVTLEVHFVDMLTEIGVACELKDIFSTLVVIKHDRRSDEMRSLHDVDPPFADEPVLAAA